MTKIMKNNILQGVLITLISAAIIGMLTLATDYYVTKQEQELINNNNDKTKAQLNRLYRVTVNQMNQIDDKVDRVNAENNEQHRELYTAVKELKYVIIKNNKDMRKDLEELKQSQLISDK